MLNGIIYIVFTYIFVHLKILREKKKLKTVYLSLIIERSTSQNDHTKSQIPYLCPGLFSHLGTRSLTAFGELFFFRI